MLIKKLRLQRGWSQQQLAEFSGLSTRTIQRLEKGDNAGMETLKSLAAVFEVDLSDLQGDITMKTHSDTNQRTLHLSLEEQRAFKEVENLREFYCHLGVFCVVIPALFILNHFTTPGYIWAWWPLFGWGIGLAIHGVSVLINLPLLGPEWERRQVEKRLGRKL